MNKFLKSLVKRFWRYFALYMYIGSFFLDMFIGFVFFLFFICLLMYITIYEFYITNTCICTFLCLYLLLFVFAHLHINGVFMWEELLPLKLAEKQTSRSYPGRLTVFNFDKMVSLWMSPLDSVLERVIFAWNFWNHKCFSFWCEVINSVNILQSTKKNL